MGLMGEFLEYAEVGDCKPLCLDSWPEKREVDFLLVVSSLAMPELIIQ